jgi:hypothetical protein
MGEQGVGIGPYEQMNMIRLNTETQHLRLVFIDRFMKELC